MHTVKVKIMNTRTLKLALCLLIAIHIHSIRTENIKIQPINEDIKESILSGNNTKLNELAPQQNNELIAYNQLLPYLYSKLPIPASLINQLRKYNINKNMLNKIHSYNKLRRDLHSKLIENEINGYKYNDILSKKLQNLFNSVTQEEKKNFLNLINYLKMFNFDNNKLYNTLHDGNDLFKLISDNRIKYLPFINTDKTLPDLFTNNKVSKEIRRILIQYKISSKDLYDKLINKINPYLLENTKKNNVFHQTENKENAEVGDIKPNNPYELLKERIDDLTSFRKKPRILPLNEKIHYENHANENTNIKPNDGEKREVDESLNKYINELRLMNQIEKEREGLINMKIDNVINPNESNAQEKVALLQPNPNAELLALYMVLSIPGLLSALPSKNKRLPHIKRTKEDILQHSHIEAGRLRNMLMSKNVKETLNKIHDKIKEKNYYKLGSLEMKNFGGVQMVNKKNEAAVRMGHHPFGHEQSHNLVSDNNYYDAPKLPEYGSEPINNYKEEKHINGLKLYSELKSKNNLESLKLGVTGNDDMDGNHIFNSISNAVRKEMETNQLGSKDNQLFDQLQNSKNNDLDEKNIAYFDKIKGQSLFNKLVAQGNSGVWKEDTVYSKKSNAENPNTENLINGKELFNILRDKNVDVRTKKATENEAPKDTVQKIEGEHLFDLLNPSGADTVHKMEVGEPQVNMNKFYEKLYQEFMKDNKGTLNKLDTNINKNKVVWHDQNVEIPNISAEDMNENKKQHIIKAENENNDHDGDNSKEGEYFLYGRDKVLSINSERTKFCNITLRPLLETDFMSKSKGKNGTSINFKRIRRSYHAEFSSSELRERQATLGLVLNKILDQFKITSPRGNISHSNTAEFTIPRRPSSWINMDLTYVTKIRNLGSTTDFMFSKDADIDANVLAAFYRSITTTTSKTTTPRLTLSDIEKPKTLNKKLLLLRIKHLGNAVHLNYSCNIVISRIRNIVEKLPFNITVKNNNLNQENSSVLTLRQSDFCKESLGSFQYTQICNEPTPFQTFRPYSTFKRRSSSKSKHVQSKFTNKTFIENRLRLNMLPDLETYQADRRIIENNGTYLIYFSEKDKIEGAEYVDDLLALYPNDPDILHRKFNKDQLEQQLRNYNAIFDDLSLETKRKYYITLDIYSRMDHIEQVKTGGKIVISNPNEETPSSDELKVLYDEFSHDFTDDSRDIEENSSAGNRNTQRRLVF